MGSLMCTACHEPIAVIHLMYTTGVPQDDGVYEGDSYCSRECLVKGAERQEWIDKGVANAKRPKVDLDFGSQSTWEETNGRVLAPNY